MVTEKSARPAGYYLKEFDDIYNKLDEGTRVAEAYKAESYDRSKTANEYQDYEEGESEDDGNESIDEEEEYSDFFESSKMLDENVEVKSYNQALLLEERKWIERAIWLEQQIEKLQGGDADTKQWVPWFKAKFDSLVDLDLNIQGSEELEPNAHVFYVHQFLAEQIKEQEKKAQAINDDDIDAYIRSAQYTKDQQVYVDRPNLYPRIHFDQKDAMNSDIPQIQAAFNFREKLCLKIITRERETDYFLTVYKRKELGNEKIYEKRLNLRNTNITIKKLQFQPSKGQFILLSFIKG
jgi:hypothetical protein